MTYYGKEQEDKKDIILTIRISQKTNRILESITTKSEKSNYIRNLIEKDIEKRIDENQLKLF